MAAGFSSGRCSEGAGCARAVGCAANRRAGRRRASLGTEGAGCAQGGWLRCESLRWYLQPPRAQRAPSVARPNEHSSGHPILRTCSPTGHSTQRLGGGDRSSTARRVQGTHSARTSYGPRIASLIREVRRSREGGPIPPTTTRDIPAGPAIRSAACRPWRNEHPQRSPARRLAVQPAAPWRNEHLQRSPARRLAVQPAAPGATSTFSAPRPGDSQCSQPPGRTLRTIRAPMTRSERVQRGGAWSARRGKAIRRGGFRGRGSRSGGWRC